MTAVLPERASKTRRDRPPRRAKHDEAPPLTFADTSDLSRLIDSPGQALDEATRMALEARLRVDLRAVRIHNDPPAAEIADALGSAAFTVGPHIFFGRGRYELATAAGRRLLAHEVTHAARHGSSSNVVGAVEGLEHDAAAVAERDWSQSAAERDRPDRTRPPGEHDRSREVPTSAPAASGAFAGGGLPALHFRDPAPHRVDTSIRVVLVLTRLIARTLRLDPNDSAGRVRAQLAKLAPNLKDQVIAKSRQVMSASEFQRLATVIRGEIPAGPAFGTPGPGTPHDELVDDETTATADETADLSEPDVLAAAVEPSDDPAKQALPKDATVDSTERPAPAETAAPDPATLAAKAPTDGPAPVPAPAGEVKQQVAAESPPAEPDTEAGRITQPDAGRAELAGGAAAPAAAAVAATPAEAEASPAEKRQDAEDRTVIETADAARDAGEAEEEAEAGKPATETTEPVDEGTPQTARAAGGSTLPDGPSPGQEPAESTPGPDGDGLAALSGASEAPAVEAEGDVRGDSEPQSLPEEIPGPSPSPEETAESDGEPTAPVTAQSDVPGGGEGDDAGAGFAGNPAPEPAAPDEAVAADEPPTPTAADPAEAALPVATEAGDTAEAGTDSSPSAGPEGDQQEAGAEPGDAAAEGQAGEEPRSATGPAEGGGGGLAACAGGSSEPPPAPEAEGPSGACGGGGGGGAAAPPEPAAPEVSSLPPGQALSAVGGLPATTMAETLPQVGAAAKTKVGQQRSEQTATPPSLDRPSGAAASLDVSAPVPKLAPSAYAGPTGVNAVQGPGSNPPPSPADPPVPALDAKSATAQVVPLRLPGNQPLTEKDVARVSDSIDSLPVTDPELNVSVGAPPAVETKGDADPALVDKQNSEFETKRNDVVAEGRKDVAAPMGEADIRPHVPPKTLVAAAPQGASCPGLTPAGQQGVATGGGKHPAAAVNAVVAEQSSDAIKAGVSKASGDFTQAEEKQQQSSTEARDKARQDADACVASSHDEQVRVRSEAIDASVSMRKDWSEDQRKTVTTADGASAKAVSDGARDIEDKRKDGNDKASAAVREGDAKIVEQRRSAETKAKTERANAKKESSGGILGWIGDKVSAFIDKVKSAVKAVFDLARKIVREAIDIAKKAAHAAIQLARTAIVGAIKLAGKAIIAAGDVMLAAFPETRRKFRAAVEKKVDQATKIVNDAADALERGIQALLDALASALDCALQYLEAGYLAALDVVGSVIKAALDAAQKFLDMLAEWAEIVADVAANPMAWLKNLGRSAMDGVRNCLWGALKRAVKEWFNSKVEEVIGVGKMIINVLLKGCLKLADIGRMAWEAIKAALPGILIQLLIEKLVALIVPAGAALSLIIDGLRAGWGAASRILAAFQKFMAFLKTVRSGTGAGAFAEMLAAAGIAVLDFLSNFLIGRLKGAGKGVGDSLRSMASKITKTLGKAAKAVGRGLKAVGRGVKAVGRRAVQLAKRGVAAVRRGVGALGRGAKSLISKGEGRLARIAKAVDPRRLARALARTKIGRKIAGGIRKVKAWGGRRLEQFKKWWKGRRKRKKRKLTAEERLDRALAVIRPALAGIPAGGVNRLLLWGRFRWWTFRYKLSSIRVTGGTEAEVEVRVNPKKKGGKFYVLRHEIGTYISKIASLVDPAPDPDDDEPYVGDFRKRLWRGGVAARIAADPDHPLSFLVTASGRLRRQRSSHHATLKANPHWIQAGHVMSEWSAIKHGTAQRLIVMTAHVNQRFSADFESKGQKIPPIAVLNVHGVAIERQSAKDMHTWLKEKDPAAAEKLEKALKKAPDIPVSATRRKGAIHIGGLPKHEHRSVKRWLAETVFKGLRDIVPRGVERVRRLREARRKKRGRS